MTCYYYVLFMYDLPRPIDAFIGIRPLTAMSEAAATAEARSLYPEPDPTPGLIRQVREAGLETRDRIVANI